MAQSTSECGLCGQIRPLKRSHFLPKAVYRICGADAQRPGPPVLVHKGKAILLPRQSVKPFLCTDCEGRLSEKGERYVIGQCLRSDGSFKLRDRLKCAVASEEDTASDTVSLRKLIGQNAETCIYFGVSVFWRAAATKWIVGHSDLRQIPLCQSLQEGFRLWLLGKAPFPSGAAMGLSVFNEEDLPPFAFFPVRDHAHDFALYRFAIPGVQFCLFIDKALTPDLTGVAQALPTDVPVYLEEFWKSGLLKITSEAISASSPKGKLGSILQDDESP